MKALFLLIPAVIIAACAFLAGMIVLGAESPPPPLASISRPFEAADFSALPPARFIPARGGGSIAFRQWGARGTSAPGIVAVVIHGSAGSSTSIHPLAGVLSAQGVEVYAPDIRGHGLTGQRGDIGHESELDEDFEDFASDISSSHPGARLVLAGFSSGGGFALHVAATPAASKFHHGVLISPMLGPFAPTVPKGENAWARPFIPRIIALSVLNRLGVREFNYLPVISFAVNPAQVKYLTPSYSYRLLVAFGTKDYAADLSRSRIPLNVLVGGNDELFDAARFEPAVHAVRADVPVHVVPGVNHIGMITSSDGMTAVLAALKP